MTATSARLLKLLSLLQTRRDWTGDELARRLEVSGRTIRRDIERLRELGYPVDALTGPAGGYRLHAGTAMPPLLLDDDEAVAIAVGLRTAARASVTGIEETSVRALVKLEQVLPSHLRRRVNALQTATVTLAASGGPTVDPEALTAIAGACRDRERLRFAYRGRDATESSRIVEPHTLVNLGRRWYLVAWDCDRDDWRTFRVDRLTRLSPAGVALRAARAAQRRRRGRLRGGEPLGRAVALPGPRHPVRTGRPSGRARRSSPDRPSRPSTSTRASCARATTRSTGSPCAWPWSASTSRSTSRPSSSSAFASWRPA